ncbi:SNF2-related protein [Coleofasciculus sp. G1-WW12-02]|uniref:SNF2-related protein n=1 Tax=Coleofasciculus sp. G1-WW12-02 TaxID=3068483 RepID=UPI004063D546
MAILHGSWITRESNNYLFIWGERWRPLASVDSAAKNQIMPHPFGMTQAELREFLRDRSLTIPEPETGKSQADAESAIASWQTHLLVLPTHPTASKTSAYPLLSAQLPPTDETDSSSLELQKWSVSGYRLTPSAALPFLQSLPLGGFNVSDNYVGSDLRFWTHVYRWSLDLLTRCKFVPGLYRQPNDEAIAYWQPLLDSATDQTRLAEFTQSMPLACQAYEDNVETLHATSLHPQSLILNFLRDAINTQVKNWVESLSPPTATSPLPEWLQALCSDKDSLEVEPMAIARLDTALSTWTTSIQQHLVTPTTQDLTQNLFRTCLVLQPPEPDETNWRLDYCLQAMDDADLLVDAKTIWRHPVEQLDYHGRTIEQPQETLLKGLGLASRLYPPLEASLHERCPQFCELNPVQVYEFIKASAWRLQDSGLGIILPPGLAPGSGEKRLGISITAEAPKSKKEERLGLQSLLKFKWDLAIGDTKLSKSEFQRLMSLKSPLVEVNGEWIALQPADARAAHTILTASKEDMSLSVEDALRLATGDTKTLGKLPVVHFEASGALQELITNLTGNRTIEPIEVPQDFNGTLRPYQLRGASWLAFLERWGLGACLADDMGLGKCIAPSTLISVNGTVIQAEDIWKQYATEAEFDGEGFWSQPTESLLINAIDSQTHKMTTAPIQRLYRQRVQEKLRTVKLKDGSQITITYRHKLLTNHGWTTNFQVGDYVCVPAKMIWQGQPEDPDLVKFMAWQIAEGCEQSDRARVNISHKDKDCLQDLLQIFKKIGQRYNIKINNPSICTYPNRVPDLRIDSQAYREFLQTKGYSWGMRSDSKSIPDFIMQADLDTVKIFLQNYFDAEASVISQMRSIEISTASPLLIQQLSVLLRRLGIWLQITPQHKRETNGKSLLHADSNDSQTDEVQMTVGTPSLRPDQSTISDRKSVYICTIGGNSVRRLLQVIGFNCPEKQRKLEEICKPETWRLEVAATQTKSAYADWIIEVDNQNLVSQPFSRASRERVISSLSEQFSLTSTLPPSSLPSAFCPLPSAFKKLSALFSSEYLQNILDQDVFYCQIQDIEDIDYEGWVYDFEVSHHHNFVANNILCHNTIQTIAFLLHLKEQDVLESPTLLVCPTSVLGNWEREVKKFAPTLKAMVHHGDKRSKGKTFAKAVKNQDLVITSYPLVYRDATTLEAVSWQGVVLDEAQNIKNPGAKQSQAVRKLPTEFRIALTGTPVENRLSELWSILDFLNPQYLGDRQFFQRRFAMPIEKFGDRDSLQTLRSLVQPFILRRLKTDKTIIQDLPEKQEMTVFCGLAAEQATLYQKLVDESLVEIEAAEGIKRKGLILTLLMRLKQVCNHPAQLLKEKTLKDAKRSGKLLRLQEMLDEAISEGDRALIFTQFAEWGKLLQPYLAKQFDQEILFLYGATRKNQREEMIDRFQNDPEGPPILILSLKAGGTGLNLTRANHVFHIDRWWNPAVENQATDRAFRIGQTRNVQVHKFVCTGTLEERINDMIESKKQLAEQTVEAGENWVTDMDTDQLRSLLLLDRTAVIDE